MNVFDIICIAFGLVGIASTVVSIISEKKIIKKLKHYKKVIAKKKSRIQELKEEIDFLKLQVDGSGKWLKNIINDVESGDTAKTDNKEKKSAEISKDALNETMKDTKEVADFKDVEEALADNIINDKDFISE